MMENTCIKCGHFNSAATGAATDACPKCGAIYAKLQQIFGARPEQTAVDSRAAVRRSPTEPFIERLRAQSQYPAFRSVVGAFCVFGYVVAVLVFVAAAMAVWRGEVGFFLGGLVFACAIGVLSKVAKEASLMLADLSDAMVRVAERNEG